MQRCKVDWVVLYPTKIEFSCTLSPHSNEESSVFLRLVAGERAKVSSNDMNVVAHQAYRVLRISPRSREEPSGLLRLVAGEWAKISSMMDTVYGGSPQWHTKSPLSI